MYSCDHGLFPAEPRGGREVGPAASHLTRPTRNISTSSSGASLATAQQVSSGPLPGPRPGLRDPYLLCGRGRHSCISCVHMDLRIGSGRRYRAPWVPFAPHAHRAHHAPQECWRSGGVSRNVFHSLEAAIPRPNTAVVADDTTRANRPPRRLSFQAPPQIGVYAISVQTYNTRCDEIATCGNNSPAKKAMPH